MAADQASGKRQPAIIRLVRVVTQPGGKDVDWEKVGAVGAIVGALIVLHGRKGRSWRYVHTAATVLVIGSAAAGRLKKYAGASEAPAAAE